MKDLPQNISHDASREPYTDLAMAVLTAAVTDYRVLEARGVVRGGKVLHERWPVKPAYPPRVVGRPGVTRPARFDGMGPTEARQLIAFLNGPDWERLATAIGVRFSQRAMLHRLQFGAHEPEMREAA